MDRDASAQLLRLYDAATVPSLHSYAASIARSIGRRDLAEDMTAAGAVAAARYLDDLPEGAPPPEDRYLLGVAEHAMRRIGRDERTPVTVPDSTAKKASRAWRLTEGGMDEANACRTAGIAPVTARRIWASWEPEPAGGPGDPDIPEPDEEVPSIDARALRLALDTLPTSAADLLRRSWGIPDTLGAPSLKRQTVPELAASFGVSPATVKRRTAEARAQLRTALAPMSPPG